MLKNYFLTAFRVFWRKKVFSIINIMGLSIGISAALVIYLIVHYDFSFDRFEKNGERIYRVVSDLKFAGTPLYFSGVPDPLGEAVRTEVPGLEITAAFHEFNGDANVAVRTDGSDRPGFSESRKISFSRMLIILI